MAARGSLPDLSTSPLSQDHLSWQLEEFAYRRFGLFGHQLVGFFDVFDALPKVRYCITACVAQFSYIYCVLTFFNNYIHSLSIQPPDQSGIHEDDQAEEEEEEVDINKEEEEVEEEVEEEMAEAGGVAEAESALCAPRDGPAHSDSQSTDSPRTGQYTPPQYRSDMEDDGDIDMVSIFKRIVVAAITCYIVIVIFIGTVLLRASMKSTRMTLLALCRIRRWRRSKRISRSLVWMPLRLLPVPVLPP